MYPTRVNLFIPWSKAMVAGATVGKPAYPGGKMTKRSKKSRRRRKRRTRKLKRKD